MVVCFETFLIIAILPDSHSIFSFFFLIFPLVYHIITRKNVQTGADLEVGSGFRTPWNFKIYISENNISRFSALSGGNFACLFQNSHVIISNYNERTCLFRHYRSTILQIALGISRLCIVHLCRTTKTPDIYYSTL